MHLVVFAACTRCVQGRHVIPLVSERVMRGDKVAVYVVRWWKNSGEVREKKVIGAT